MVLLFGIGFAVFGSQVLLVGTAPADVARRGTAAAAAGFVNFMGYMGAFTGDLVTGWCPLCGKQEYATRAAAWAAVRALGLRSVYACLYGFHASAARPRPRPRYCREREARRAR